LIEGLDEGPAEEGVEEAWDAEIKRRIDDIRAGKVKMIPGERVLRFHPEAGQNFRDAVGGSDFPVAGFSPLHSSTLAVARLNSARVSRKLLIPSRHHVLSSANAENKSFSLLRFPSKRC